MEKPQLTPSIILSAALVASSLILTYGMFHLGDDILDASIISKKVTLQNANGSLPLRVVLDDKSELKIDESSPDSSG